MALARPHPAPEAAVAPARTFGRPKAARLRRPAEYALVYETGRKVQGTHMVHVFRYGGDPRARVGITVGKKVGNAVVRNRVRRRLRDLGRTRYPALPAGLELVITARASAASADYAALERDFDRCLQRGRRLWQD